jgi:hypothetical protein
MRLASYASYGLMLAAALGCAVACGDDDDAPAPSGKSGSSTAEGGEGGTTSGGGKAGTSGTATKPEGGEGGAPAGDSKLCTDLGGPAGIDGVVRGDGKTSKTDPFNGFKFEKDGRQGSVLLNVATDPCIGQQFAHLLAPAKAAELEHLAQCLSLFVQNAAGCAVAYDEDTEGKACKSMKTAHLGLGITEEDYTALITDAAKALIAAGVDPASPQFAAVAGALTADSLKADIITSEAMEYSQPTDMCVDPGAGGAGGMGGAGGSP